MRRMLLLLLLALAPMAARAQHSSTPIARSLYLALGGDPMAADRASDMPRALSLGVEQSRAGSRWAFRFGTDYMRTTYAHSDLRREEFGAGVGVRYGRRSGVVRPYLLGGVGIANLRTNALRFKGDYVYQDVILPRDTTIAGTSRWNGVLTPGFGTEISLGRVRLFTEARINFYPRFLTDRRRYGADRGTKALFIGVKF